MSIFKKFQDEVNAGTFEVGGGDMAPIPKGTAVLAACESASNESFEDQKYVNLKWRVAQPAQYENRVIFQKVRIYGPPSPKRDTAERMLFAIATNAGGGLIKAMEAAGEEFPSNQSLQQLCNRPMVLKLDVWEIDGKKGNWVQAVSPHKNGGSKPAAKPAPPPVTAADNVFDDDIPF